MTRKSIFLITLFVLGLNSASFGQVTKLEAWQPQIIKDNNGNPTGIGKGQEWQTWCEEKLKTDGIGQNTGTVWIVRSDRDNNPTYSSPSLSNPTGKTLKFGDQLYVAKYENGFAYVFSTPKTVAPNTPIPPSSNFMGWVPISNLLLWENCPKNRSQIARKALVVYDPAGSSSNDEGPVEEPRFFNAPGTDASISNYKANSLDVLFVLKKVEIEKKTYYLLSTQNTIRGRADLKGWLPSEYVTPWDHRLALEPTSIPSIVNNFKSKGLKPVAYSRLENAVTFFNNATIGNPLYKYDNFSSERMDPYVMRMPIIDSTPYKQINKIAVTQALSEAGKPTGGRGYELSRAETQRTISELHEKQKNINIVFVVDAGRSLNNFYPHLANAIKAVGGNNFFNNPEISSSINIGLVTYGNASDEIEYYKLSHDVQPLVSKINGIEVTEVDTGSRALFLGLETALDCRKMNYSPDHSNFIILIGNTCNSNTDANGRHWTEACTRIADKMFDNRINFLAYQIIGDYSEPFTNFSMQVSEIQNNLKDRYAAKINNDEIEYKYVSETMQRLVRKTNNGYDLPIYSINSYPLQDSSQSASVISQELASHIQNFYTCVTERINQQNLLAEGAIRFTTNADEKAVREALALSIDNKKKIDNIIKYMQMGGAAKFTTYAPMMTKQEMEGSHNSLYQYVLFFTGQELRELYRMLDNTINADGSDDRKKYQDAVIMMGKAMLGDISKKELHNMNISEVMGQIYGVPGNISTSGMKIDEITAASKAEVAKHLSRFRSKLDGLREILDGDGQGCRFMKSSNDYYWIPVDKMPGFEFSY